MLCARILTCTRTIVNDNGFCRRTIAASCHYNSQGEGNTIVQ